MGIVRGGKRPTVSECIVAILADEFPLSINELKFRIKSQHSLSVSYQAVHKEVMALLEKGVLKREGSSFLLDLNWVQQKSEFYSRAESNVLNRRVVAYISFNLNGTLSPEQFDKLVWNEKIPLLYARKFHLTLAAAKQRVYAEYYRARYIEKVPNWTDIEMWFDRLGLTDWEALLEEMKREVGVYDDVLPVLEQLSNKYTLVIIARSELKFIELKLEAVGMRKYFTHIISTATNLHLPEKNVEAYERSLTRLHLKPEQIIHVGNDANTDYEIPMRVGIRSYLLDRTGSVDGPHIVHSLHELQRVL